MTELLTLFLGLVSGSQTIEVAVAADEEGEEIGRTVWLTAFGGSVRR